MAKYYMANTVFQPYTYEQLYTTARDLTAAHNEQEAKLGALDSMAAGVEAYLDPSKHPEDQAMYDTLQNYRNGLNNVTYHLASRGLNGHVFNNVMSLAADYSGKVKPIEGAIENYKKAHDMRVALMTQNPDYIPRYSWDDISVSENLNGASQRAVEGFKGTQYMNDITTTLQKLFNDFGLTRRKDIRVLGHQIYNYISNGVPLKTALAWFADQTQMTNEDRAKMMLALGTIDKRYGVDEALENLNPSLSGYRTQGIINAIGTNEMKSFALPTSSGGGSGRGLGVIPPLPASLTASPGQPFRPANLTEEARIDANRNAIIDKKHPFPSARIDVTDNTDPRSHGEVFYNEFYKRMKNYVGPDGKTHDYSRFAKWSPKKVFTNPEFPLIKGLTKGVEELAGLDIGAQEAYNQCWRQAVMQKGYYLNDEPTEVTTQVKPTINNFMAANKSEIFEINKDGTMANKPISTYDDKDIKTFLDGAWQMGFSYIPSYYNVYPQLDGESGLGKNDKIFIKIYYDNNKTKDFIADISSLLGKSKNDDLMMSTSSFNEYNPKGTDLFEEYTRVHGLDRLRESELHIENTILDFAVDATKQTRKEEKGQEE